MFGPVAETILFRESDGSGAVFIEGSGSSLSGTQFVCKLSQINWFFSGGGEGNNFALSGAVCEKGDAIG